MFGSLNLGAAQMPKFEDYMVAARANRRSEPAYVAREHTEQEVRSVAMEGPDFAGHFTIVSTTCGSNCLNLWIVDALTGAVFETPFLGVAGGTTAPDRVLLYRLDSALFIATGRIEIVNDGNVIDSPCGRFYFHWTGTELVWLTSRIYACGADPDDPPSPSVLVELAATGQSSEVKRLLSAGVDINGGPALVAAARAGFPGMVKLLLQYGARVNQTDGDTALHAAAARGHSEVVDVLLAAGADRQIRNRQGFTASDVAWAAHHEALAARIDRK